MGSPGWLSSISQRPSTWANMSVSRKWPTPGTMISGSAATRPSGRVRVAHRVDHQLLLGFQRDLREDIREFLARHFARTLAKMLVGEIVGVGQTVAAVGVAADDLDDALRHRRRGGRIRRLAVRFHEGLWYGRDSFG